MTVPLELYEIRLYDNDGVFIDFLQGWEYLEYAQRVDRPWNYYIRYTLSFEDERLDTLRAIERDSFVLIYRTSPRDFTKTLVFEGINQTVVDQALVDGNIQVSLYGQGYTAWLKDRVIIPDTGQDVSEKAGVAETVMKAYVDEALINPADADRDEPGLVNEADGGRGDAVTYSARYTNLQTVLENLAQDGNIHFGIVGTDDPPTAFEFQTREVWGDDRRINSTMGNDPCFFNYHSKSQDIPILSRNYSEEKTVVYVGGQGVGANRVLLELENVTATAESPRARKEAFIDNRGTDTQDEMLTLGQAYLEENANKNSLTFNLRADSNIVWLEDFWLGDIVTVKYYDHLASKEITDIVVKYTSGESAQIIERIDIEMKDLSEAQIDYLATWTIDYYDPDPFIECPLDYCLGDGLSNTLIGLAIMYDEDAGSNIKYNAIAAVTTSICGGAPVWTLASAGLPDDGNGYPRYITTINLDPYDQNSGLITGSQGIYRNTAVFSGGAWSQIVSYADILAAWNAKQARADAGTPYISDCEWSMAEAGCGYLLCKNPFTGTDGENCIFPVQILNYGDTVTADYAHLIRIGGVEYTDMRWGAASLNKGGGCGIVTYKETRDNVFVSAGSRYTASRFVCNRAFTFGGLALDQTYNGVKYNWLDHIAGPTDLNGPTYGFPYMPFTSLNGQAPDQEYYHIHDKKIWRALGLQWWDPNMQPVSLSGQYARIAVEDDIGPTEDFGPCRDTYGCSMLDDEQFWYLYDDGATTVLNLNDDATLQSWTSKALPASFRCGWAGGWPGQKLQFYIGRNSRRLDCYAAEGNPLVYFSLDGGDTWNDCTGNLWDLIPDIPGYTPYVGVIRMTPQSA